MHPSTLSFICGAILVTASLADGSDGAVWIGCALMAIGIFAAQRRSIKKLNRLTRGMRSEEAVALLGTPDQKEIFEGGLETFKYRLFQWGVGWKPVYVAVHNGRLRSATVNQEEFEREVAQSLEAFKLSVKSNKST